ncbi:Lrp/AsnC family transcriptional regulator [Bradyrhizobium sp. 14AA]
MRYDRTDARILEIVQKNKRLTSEAIGELAGLSATACQRRLKINGFYVTGDADFVLYITACTMDDYEQFTRRFFYQNPDIKGFKTMVIMDRVKAGFAVPVEVPSED